MPNRFTFCLFRKNIDICGKNYIRLNKGQNLGPSIINRNKKINNPNISINIIDKKVNNSSSDITGINSNGKENNSGISTSIAEKKQYFLSKSIMA